MVEKKKARMLIHDVFVTLKNAWKVESILNVTEKKVKAFSLSAFYNFFSHNFFFYSAAFNFMSSRTEKMLI